MITLISHFYNEEFLLPYWVRWHLRYQFDRAVLIDYGSTDSSVEIIKSLAPSWEVRSSKVPHFGAAELDQQVMELELEIGGGWKLALNTTEFLITGSLHREMHFRELKHPGAPAFGFPSYVMCGPAPKTGLGPDLPFSLTRGFYDPSETVRRRRFIHRAPHGNYHIGRHGVGLPGAKGDDDIAVLWYGWSPYPEVKTRKLQIKDRIPQGDKDRGWGWQHLMDSDALDAEFAQLSSRSNDLSGDPKFSGLIQAYCMEHNIQEAGGLTQHESNVRT